MDKEYIIKKLPIQPTQEHISRVFEENEYEFEKIQQGFCFFKRELMNEFDSEFDWLFETEENKTVYGAHCVCSECGQEFSAGYKCAKGNDSRSGIILTTAELEETYYTGYCTEKCSSTRVIKEEETFFCPLCETPLRLKKFSDLKDNDGYLFATRSGQVINVGKYTAIITWEHFNEVYVNGYSDKGCIPRTAAVLDEDGSLELFDYYNNRWEHFPFSYEEYPLDGFQETYRDDDSINDTKLGGILDTVYPELEGTTGEKTGLAEFIDHGGHFVTVYLENWYENPYIENLIKSPFGATMAKILDGLVEEWWEYSENSPIEAIPEWENIDFNQAKPHKMLGISKEQLAEFNEIVWDLDAFDQWADMKDVFSPLEAQKLYKKFESGTILAFVQLLREHPEVKADKALKYLEKQKKYNKYGMEIFIDYVNMLKGELTHEKLYPKNLEAAHDEQVKRNGITPNSSAVTKFIAVKEKYKALEFNDGKLCVKLPNSPCDLIDEGEVLNHCVGGYVDTHANGKKIILFIRHYRRPERSYYTLNIDFSGKKPKEIQLHGYGNERHGANKQYSHTIPRKVREFVDKWKEEILLPWAIAEEKRKRKTA